MRNTATNRLHALLVVPALAVCACGATRSEEPRGTPPEPPGAVEPARPTDRELYDLLVRLATHPEQAPELAPGAVNLHHGEHDETRPITDFALAFGWIRDTTYVTAADLAATEDEGSDCTCDAANLRCVIVQPGGWTILQFGWSDGAGPRHLVVQRLETEDP